jgi:hypothetical protein
MDLRAFPFDSPACRLSLQSYSLPSGKVEYSWAGDSVRLQGETGRSAGLGPRLAVLPEIEFSRFALSKSNVTEGDGLRSRLQLLLHFDRPLGYYLIEIYSPAIFIVIMSWFNFWLHRSATPARITLGVTTILTLTALMAKADANLPKTAYIKAIGIYLWVCFVFTFAALVEFSVAAYMEKRRAMLHRAAKDQTEISLVSIAEQTGSETGSAINLSVPGRPKRKTSFISQKMNDPQLLEAMKPGNPDLYSRVLFPLAFAGFNVFYWVYYLALPNTPATEGIN